MSAGSRRRLARGTRWLRRAFLPVSLLIFAGAFFNVPLPQVADLDCCSAFVEVPGRTLNLDETVEVRDDQVTELNGEFMVVTVTLHTATAFSAVRAWTADNVALVAREAVVPQGVTNDTYFDRQRSVFDTSAGVAASVGLRAAGYDVDPDALTGAGALVVSVLDGSPAEGALQPGDIIVEVDGTSISVAEEVRPLIGEGVRPREVTYVRNDRRATVTLEPRLISFGETSIVGIGVEINTADPRVVLPVPVEVDSGRIGGPSAGLVIALTVYDKAEPDVDLAAGRRIAATGTLAPDGTVGSIGGIVQKVAAAERDAADLFLVPTPQAAEAAAARSDGSSLEILSVGTFDDAVELLMAPEADTVGLRW